MDVKPSKSFSRESNLSTVTVASGFTGILIYFHYQNFSPANTQWEVQGLLLDEILSCFFLNLLTEELFKNTDRTMGLYNTEEQLNSTQTQQSLSTQPLLASFQIFGGWCTSAEKLGILEWAEPFQTPPAEVKEVRLSNKKGSGIANGCNLCLGTGLFFAGEMKEWEPKKEN